MTYTFTIEGRLPSLNEYTNACRRNAYAGAEMKARAQLVILKSILDQLNGLKIKKPVHISYKWFESNKRRDHDNVTGFGHKVIQDSMVKIGMLIDDGWDEITGFNDAFYLDKENPRIEVTVIEVE